MSDSVVRQQTGKSKSQGKKKSTRAFGDGKAL